MNEDEHERARKTCDPMVLNKHGVIESIFDQCQKTCTCSEEKCLMDDIFFSLQGSYSLYRASMTIKNKVDRGANNEKID